MARTQAPTDTVELFTSRTKCQAVPEVHFVTPLQSSSYPCTLSQIMVSVQNPTYLLAPNWTFSPGGTIALGNIIVDPFKPHRVLSKPDPTKSPSPTETVPDYNWRLHLGKNRSLNLSVWAQFLETVGVDVGTDPGKGTSTEYAMTSLDTMYFKDEPTVEDIEDRVKEDKIRNVMRMDRLLSKPVYMITGIKIARGFALSMDNYSSHEGKVGAPIPVIETVSVGANIGGLVGSHISGGFQSGGDIIFAYQLLKIIPKGFKTKSIFTREYQSRATFLEDQVEEDEDDSAIKVEVGYTTTNDLAGVFKGDSLTDLKIDDGEAACVCLSFKE